MYLDLSLPLNLEDQAETAATIREKDLRGLGHKGTHLDRFLKTEIPLDYVRSRGLKIDVSSFAAGRLVEPEDLPWGLIQNGDFIILHTGTLKRHGYGSRPYLDEFFELSWAALDMLLEKKPRFIGLDARGLRGNEEHRQADEQCERAGTFVIENLSRTELLPSGSPFLVYAFCFDVGGSGLPCRVIAQV